MKRKTQQRVVVVQVDDLDNDDAGFILVFSTKRLANDAVRYINNRNVGLEARVEQEQFVTTSFSDFRYANDEYICEREALRL